MPSTARTFLLALATMLVASRGARAQCGTGRNTRIRSFTVAAGALSFGTATAAQFDAGWVQSQYTITVTPRGGRRWYLCVSTASPNMGTVNGYTKPIGDLEWSLNGSTWTSFAFGAMQPVTSGNGTRTVTLFVRTLLSYPNDVPQADLSPGAYGASLAFRVSM